MEWNFGDIFLTMLSFYFFFMVAWMFVGIFSDIFRRKDLSGGGKAGWLLLIILLPFIGCLAYMFSRPPVSDEKIALMRAARRARGGHSVADEVAKLADLRSKGTLSEEEFVSLKAQAMA